MMRRLDRAAFALLALFVFSMPWEKSVWIPGVGTLARLFGMLAFASGGAVMLARRSLRPPNLAMVWAALFVAWSAATWLWSYDRAATVVRVGTFVELFAMLWLVWDFCRSDVRQTRLMQAYVCGAVAACGNALVRYLAHRQTYYRRYAAAGFDPNDFGLILALAIPLALYLSLRARGGMRWVWRAAVLAIEMGLLLTASRTALIAAFVAFGFALLAWRAGDLSHRLSSLVLFAVLLAGVFQFAPAHSRERLATIPNEIGRGTLHNRTKIWKTGLRVFQHRPLRGIGAGAYPAAVRPWLGVPGVPGHQYVAHNTFLSVLVESGAVGFGLFALLLATLAVFISTMRPTERALWAAMLVVWAVGVSTLTWEQYKPTWLLFALILTEWARAFWPAPAKA